jgi:hypothetical protein
MTTISPRHWLYAVRSGVGGLGASGVIVAACSAFVIGVGTFAPPGTSGSDHPVPVRNLEESRVGPPDRHHSRPRRAFVPVTHRNALSAGARRRPHFATSSNHTAGRRTLPVADPPAASGERGSRPGPSESSPPARRERSNATASDPAVSPEPAQSAATPPPVASRSSVPPLPIAPTPSPTLPAPPVPTPSPVSVPTLPPLPAATAPAVPSLP